MWNLSPVSKILAGKTAREIWETEPAHLSYEHIEVRG